MTDVTGSTDYAKVAIDVWQPSKKLSDELRDLLPSSRDLFSEVSRFRLPGVEFMLATHTGPSLRIAVDDDNVRAYKREKFYVRVFLDSEVVIARDVDEIRRACFEGAALAGTHIGFRVMDVIESLRPQGPFGATFLKAQADWYQMPMTVRFTGQPMKLPQHRWADSSFACFDPMSDRVALHFATYFTVAPPGEAVVDE